MKSDDVHLQKGSEGCLQSSLQGRQEAYHLAVRITFCGKNGKWPREVVSYCESRSSAATGMILFYVSPVLHFKRQNETTLARSHHISLSSKNLNYC